ncbi:amidase [Pradoshia sp.]
MQNSSNAYMDNQAVLPALHPGPLDGMSFSIKDIFAIKGHTNSAGNPDWLRTHEEAASHAPVLETLLQNGASMKGITITDELMFSLDGVNVHYGTPLNPKAPNHIPGGSSSGTAVSVACGDVDFSIGTDTGGSIRIPASYCGLYGFRPTHGAISMEGCIPLALSFDTVGWIAREPGTLRRVGEALFEETVSDQVPFDTLHFPSEIWGSLLDEEIREAVRDGIVPWIPIRFHEKSISLQEFGFKEWADIFRIIQGYEIWKEHGEWIKHVNPSFGPGIRERIEIASAVQEKEMKAASDKRMIIKQIITNLLDDNGLIVLPTAVQGAPSLHSSPEELNQTRLRNIQLTCIAGLCGLPQLTIPFIEVNGCPIGLSFVANRGQDLRLLALGEELVHQKRISLLK